MKKIITILLAVLMMLTAAGCSEATPSQTEEPEAIVPSPEVSLQPETLSQEQQRQLIMDSYESWRAQDEYYSPWYYSITDLDHNGRLEVIAASMQGTGLFTFATLWEVNEEGTALVSCQSNLDEWQDWPDIIRNEFPSYYDSTSGKYYYVCGNDTRNGAAEHYFSQCVLCLYEGQLEIKTLCYGSEIYSDPDAEPVVSYSTADGQPLTEAEYNAYADEYFQGMEKSSFSPQWTQGPEAATEAEEASPAPEAPDKAEEVQITVTKNPSSEALTVGGKTWFIAHADKAQSLTWQLVSPEGTVCSLEEAMAANPGLSLEALEGDTLAVSNVPLSFNGWAVQARFDGQGSSVTTSPAFIYVGDYLSAYSSVIEKYKAALAASVSTEADCSEYGVSEMLPYRQSVGYGFKDLDKDGVPELLIAETGTEETSRNILYAVYTLVDGQPTELGTSWPRSRLYLLSSNRIYNAGSGGASRAINNIYRLEEGRLILEEAVLSGEDGNGGIAWYYSTDEDADFSNDTLISEDEAKAYLAAYEAGIFLPQLTKLD